MRAGSREKRETVSRGRREMSVSSTLSTPSSTAHTLTQPCCHFLNNSKETCPAPPTMPVGSAPKTHMRLLRDTGTKWGCC